MSIVLITGQPGSGKTLKCVDMLANDPQWADRPLYVMGIPELLIPHDLTPPVKEWTELRQAPEDETLQMPYFTFPPKSVVVIDEAQRVYRPRSVGSKVPLEVQAFETHRHTGVDFILLTQNPGLLDSNIRKLVGKHIHIAVTPFGRYSYEWTKCADVESNAERQIAARGRYILPSRSFHLYKSSELHTKIKTRIPLYAYLFGIALIGCIGIAAYIYHRITGKQEEVSAVAKLNGQQVPSQLVPLTKAQYLEREIPRVPGLHHTAPVYDEITKPKEAPIPVGCFINHQKNDCRCVDQQGNDYMTTKALCNGFVQHGLFIAFRDSTSVVKVTDRPEPKAKGEQALSPPETYKTESDI